VPIARWQFEQLEDRTGGLPWGKAECMHASIACVMLFKLYEDYVWVLLGNVMKAKQMKAKRGILTVAVFTR
jgi:hypothetical protein